MENNKVIEGNKLIAKFLGWKGNVKFHVPRYIEYVIPWFYDDPKEDIDYVIMRTDQLEFHSSWDWLMPAIKKFDTLFDGKYFRSKSPKWYSVYEGFCDKIDHKVTLYEILPVWESFVEAIKWYNSKFVNSQKPSKQ